MAVFGKEELFAGGGLRVGNGSGCEGEELGVKCLVIFLREGVGGGRY